MSEAARKFSAYRTVYGPNRTARNEIVHAVLVSDYDALLARCEAAEARLAEAERLLRAWDGIDYEECEFGDFVAVAIDQHEFDTAREGLDDFLRPDNEAEAQEPPR